MYKNNNKIDSSIPFAAKAEKLDQINHLSNVGVSRWKVDKNCVNYQKHDSHTLSMYITGGETSYRADHPAKKGAPGKIILMPESHEFNWAINGEIEFVHLYFTDKMLKQFAASHFDCDVRFIDLQDLTYKQDSRLQNLFLEYFSTCGVRRDISSLFAEQTLDKIFYHIITHYNGFEVKDHPVRAGLSPIHRRKIKSSINDRLNEKLTIEKLAKLVGLSPFHFARMFKLSFGETPAQFINRTRIEKVKQYLKTPQPIAEISVSTGFSQQSHMTHQFKKMTGVTPATYRTHCV